MSRSPDGGIERVCTKKEGAHREISRDAIGCNRAEKPGAQGRTTEGGGTEREKISGLNVACRRQQGPVLSIYVETRYRFNGGQFFFGFSTVLYSALKFADCELFQIFTRSSVMMMIMMMMMFGKSKHYARQIYLG
jgi:hypothetical protein